MYPADSYIVNSFINLSIVTCFIFQSNWFPVYGVSMKSATFTSLESLISNKRIDTDLIVENLNYQKLDCVSDCLNDVNCESVGYHSDQKRCRRYRVLVSGSVGITESGWGYYSIREDFCSTENFNHNRILDVCYTTFQEFNPCAKAKTMCSNLSANLLTVDSQTKQDWARDLCVSNNVEGTFFDAYLDSIASAWKLGSTGMELTYTYWDPGQPDLAGTCIGMKLYHGWGWHDYESGWTTGVICEIRRP